MLSKFQFQVLFNQIDICICIPISSPWGFSFNFSTRFLNEDLIVILFFSSHFFRIHCMFFPVIWFCVIVCGRVSLSEDGALYSEAYSGTMGHLTLWRQLLGAIYIIIFCYVHHTTLLFYKWIICNYSIWLVLLSVSMLGVLISLQRFRTQEAV